MIIQFLWLLDNEQGLEASVPVLWHGEHIRRMGWANEIVLVFLEGLHLLSKSYRSSLERLGYHILDGEATIRRVSNDYPLIASFDRTLKYWFLRWNVLDLLIEDGSVPKNVVHLDGDVVLMADPKRLEQDVSGKTFMLQGCPAWTAISDSKWFHIWTTELRRFVDNPADFVAHALAVKLAPTRPHREVCNQCTYISGIYHDQDMLQSLIAAGKLPQASTAEVFDSDFYWIQNPLFPSEWFVEQGNGSPQIRELETGPFVGQKQVAFYHFQTDFTQYCHYWLLLNAFGMTKVAPALRLNPTTGRVAIHGKLIRRTLRGLIPSRAVHRREIYERVFRMNLRTGNLNITDIVNSCWN